MPSGKILAATIGLLSMVVSVQADTIALRTFVRVSPGAALTISDLAELSGPDAEAQGGVVVVSGSASRAPGSTMTVDLARVREALEKQAKLNFGRLTLSGTTCLVRVVAPEQAAPVVKHTSTPAAPTGETVRDRVAARIAVALAAAPSDLKLSFEDQADLLAMSTAGRTVTIQPTAMGDRIPMSIRVYEGDTIVSQGTARVGVQVLREVLVAKTTLSRGMTANADALDTDHQWLTPTAAPATRDQAVGAVIRGHVEAGKVVMQRDVEPPVIVKRGDLVTVDCIAGTVVVGTTARAKEPGRDGQVIEFQSLQSKKTFQARVNGAGRAVLVAPGDETAKGSEQTP
jgi:flagella basal body P-ring formation protein FlgA